ncbi:hypothetical protein CfE428DRAFT_6552 [Chthoniobacter flavus Ellin428]|uniref:YcxB-like C-terminal domain-containing protein n=1 Tax=Chthoniobacter flavus Ellin428 TaxID=497964 RepID=B4DCB1_9BACT|nr:YcxB family protein [Chthoniobacter flavus]EDY15941.1 hypothetical protein CfE428DRAFT_6552 [Chthoniobacter flavus Ellin428]TCO82533.1 YcxB-like protein [Chthoniobacter flavus]
MASIQYTNTFADILSFSAYTYSRSPVMLALYSLLFGFACISSYTAVPASAALGIRLLTTAIMVLLFMLAFFIFFSVIVLLSLISKANKTFLTQHTITLADTGLIEETEFNRTEQRWPGIPRLVRTRRYIYAYISQYAAHVIPRRAFSDAASWESFYEELQSRVRRNA